MGTEELHQIISASQQYGSRTYSTWNADVFTSIMEGAVTKLSTRLTSDSRSNGLFAAYVRLIGEGLGLGRLTPIPDPSGRIETSCGTA
jgi:hypothetical protein